MTAVTQSAGRCTEYVLPRAVADADGVQRKKNAYWYYQRAGRGGGMHAFVWL